MGYMRHDAIVVTSWKSEAIEEAAAKARCERELAQSKTAAEREAALAKLTPHERKVLGL